MGSVPAGGLRDYEAEVWIDGWCEPPASDWKPVLDKSTGKPFARYGSASAEQVDRAVRSARRAQAEWAGVDANTRCEIIRAFARELENRHDELITLIIRETGGTAEKAAEELEQSVNQLLNSATQLTENAGSVLPPVVSWLMSGMAVKALFSGPETRAPIT